eukprot:6201856-Amphidinium_carterae.2
MRLRLVTSMGPNIEVELNFSHLWFALEVEAEFLCHESMRLVTRMACLEVEAEFCMRLVTLSHCGLFVIITSIVHTSQFLKHQHIEVQGL